MPLSAARMRALPRSRFQNGSAPATSRKDGAKIASRHSAPPLQPDGGACMDAPRKAANANSGPGIAWAAP